MKKIDHIGIAVPELDSAVQQYQDLGFEFDHIEEVPEQKVRTAFFELGESHVELLEATDPASPIAKFLDKRGPGIHHLCVEVDDIEAALADYKAKGVRLVNETPVIGAGGHRVAFVHPKATQGVLLELLERKPD
ncbi:methylmalonyl-CoA epimerase [Acanthopleuribacter pedis]|uniref:Methylmalonyl-CoA epimerase n=1 Tax=Acanthopleuribacter pedis TaxID=442870 RepID=A0A8J7U4V9_9BACT|nr:methylmalonyl-CoA epimerase [Acanthopleuribacter pedis]